jgi:hypothetical protein
MIYAYTLALKGLEVKIVLCIYLKCAKDAAKFYYDIKRDGSRVSSVVIVTDYALDGRRVGV